jgi:hypothetical protein
MELLAHFSRSPQRGILRCPKEHLFALIGLDGDAGAEMVDALLGSGVLGDVAKLPLVYRPRHARKEGAPVVVIEAAEGDLWFCDWMAIEARKSNQAAERTKRRFDHGGGAGGFGLPGSGSSGGTPGNGSGNSVAGPKNGIPLDQLPTHQALNCPTQKLVELFHERMPFAPRVMSAGPESQLGKAMRARWRAMAAGSGEFGGYTTAAEGLAKWDAVFAYAAKSAFLRGEVPGRNGDAPFTLSLTWLMGPRNFERVVNGHYHRNISSQQPHGLMSGAQRSVLDGVEATMALAARRGAPGSGIANPSLFD